jgi:hypothetical protein
MSLTHRSNMISPGIPAFSLHITYSPLRPPSSGFEAGPLAEQLSIHTPIPIPYKAPIDWSKIGIFVSLIPIVTLIFRFIRPVIQNRWVWAAGTILVSLVMTAGFMFTRIRGVPHIGHDGSWIAAGYQNQFGQEVQVVAMICEYHVSCSTEFFITANSRWYFGRLVPNVDDRHTVSKVSCSAACTGIPLDSSQLYRILHPRVIVPHQEQR